MTYRDLDKEEFLKEHDSLGRNWATVLAEKYDVSKRSVQNWFSRITDEKVKEETEHFVEKKTQHFRDGDLVEEWVKTHTKAVDVYENLKTLIPDLVKDLEGKFTPSEVIPSYEYENLINVYISNDIHFGALHHGKETLDRNWDLKIADKTVSAAYDYLIKTSPKTKYAIVADLGDLTEMDDFTNATPKNKNQLNVDGRWNKVLKVAYMSLIWGIERALEHHEIVYFINIAGNHDVTTGHAIKEIISAWFRNEPRVIVNKSEANIKYHRFGSTLLQFAHGDGMSMRDAGEVMFHDMKSVINEIEFCYSHFGHYHKDMVYDGRLTKSESHRNLASLNEWASHKGYRCGIGTMKSITYSNDNGEISRNLFNVSMIDDKED